MQLLGKENVKLGILMVMEKILRFIKVQMQELLGQKLQTKVVFLQEMELVELG